jgi:hypothetical protein
MLISYPSEEAQRLLEFLDTSSPVSRRCFHDAVTGANPHSLGKW